MAGRPEKYIISYFPHYTHDSKSMYIIENTYGLEGYGFWFKLLELLCNSKDLSYQLDKDGSLAYLAAKTRVQPDKAMEILNMLSDIESIDKELWIHKIIWCQNLVDNVADVFKRRKNDMPIKPIVVDSKAINVDIKPIVVNKKPINVTQRKVNNIKEKNNKKDVALYLVDVWNKNSKITAKYDAYLFKVIYSTIEKYDALTIESAIENYTTLLKDKSFKIDNKTMNDFLKWSIDYFIDMELAKEKFGKFAKKEEKESEYKVVN